MKIYEGNILTCDKEDHVYRYLVEDQGRILYTGDELPSEYDKAEKVMLGGKALIPAFADSHIHFASFVIFHAGLNVMEAKSNAEIMAMIREFVKTCKDKMILAFGASPYSVEDGVLVSRA